MKHGRSTLVVPLLFYGTTGHAVERLLVEFFALCFLTEDMPPLDTMDQAREVLRRVQEWLTVQDSGKTGFATYTLSLFTSPDGYPKAITA